MPNRGGVEEGKFPKVLRDVRGAIRARRDAGRCRRGEESAALKDGNGCQVFTVTLILSPAFVYAAEWLQCLSLSFLCLFVSPACLRVWRNTAPTLKVLHRQLKANVFAAIFASTGLDAAVKKKRGTVLTQEVSLWWCPPSRDRTITSSFGLHKHELCAKSCTSVSWCKCSTFQSSTPVAWCTHLDML